MAKLSLAAKIMLSAFLLSILTSCYHEVKEKAALPKRLIPEDSLILILTEIQLADGAVTYKRISHKKVKNEKEKYYAFIYKKYHLTPEILKDNVTYYNSSPEKMVFIYDRVLARLSQLEAEINLEVKEKEKARQDSINALDKTIYVKKALMPYYQKDKPEKFTWQK